VTKKGDSIWKYATFILLAVVVTGFFVFLGKSDRVENGSEVDVEIDDDPILGDPDAPVTIIEFSDYQCPFCAKFYSETLVLIKENYIDTGKVKFVYRDFPLVNIHNQALKAAEASECVHELGGDEAFWEIHDKLFENQRALSVDNYKKWASELGYDISDCLDSGMMNDEVQKDIQDAQAAGGRGTPHFVINGKVISGAQHYNVFEELIESELG
jgi:protein-disulfide isomerase